MKNTFLTVAVALGLIAGLICFAQPLSQNAMACTSLIVGKNATTDGSVILAANDDWPGYPSHLIHIPRKKHEPGSSFTLIRGGTIPQVAETFAYNFISCVYDTGTRKDESWIFGMNEKQVAVSMNGVYNFKEIDTTGHALEADDLPLLVLQRARTSREAVEIMGALIDKYGFNTSSIEDAEGTVTLAVADPNEGWWFEPVPGGKWVAKRVPDNAASFRANSYGIHKVDLDDNTNFLMSRDLVDFAAEKGWYEKGTPFDFANVYTKKVEWGNETDAGINLRRWRMACLFSGEDLPEDELVYEVVPKKKVSVRDVMSVLRDYLVGTKHDLTKKPEAGPYGNPFHDEWGISLSRGGTVVSQVVQLRSWLPDAIGGVMWVAMDTPATSVYTPWYAGISETPKTYTIGWATKYDPASAWWCFQEVGNLCYRRFNQAALKDVIPKWKEFEDDEFVMSERVERIALETFNTVGKEAACRFLNDYSNMRGLQAVELAKELANTLKGKYLDNAVLDW